ncbi:MAG: DNA translocase FtsK 4TM domain-containing protein [Proteobacteria bacterium]|nr:DNA translocase FtsK 4TM domain-containing protein [Pseudomonadota bacterium]
MAFFSGASSRKFKFKVKKYNSLPLLPASMHSFIANRLTDLGGIGLAAAGVSLALMLYTFNVKDPSFNTISSGGTIHNLLGKPGAYTSDLLLQTMGLSSYLFAVAFAIWGYRLLARKSLGPLSIKIPLLVVSVLSAAITLARIPAYDAWGIGVYLGGSAGSLIFTTLGNHLQPWLGTAAFTAVAVAAFSVFMICYILSLGISVRGWKRGLGQTRDGAATFGSFVRECLMRLREWHSRHTAEAVPLRKPRIRLDEDAVAEPLATGSETANTSVAACRKPVVSPRADKPKEDRQKKLNLRSSDEEWQLPSLDILEDRVNTGNYKLDEAALQKNAELLQSTLHDFGVEGEILKVSPGPIVTLYEMEPAPGTKTSRVIGLSDDVARSMSAISVRVAVVPGKNVIGIELPNAKRETVFLKDMLSARDYQKTTCKLPLVLGKNIAGEPVIADLARMPHLLVAGTTGSGKSVAVNTMILSLLYRLSPEQCRFIMVDPKMLELSVYDDIPHLLTPVVTEAHRAVTALKWAVREMEDRYRVMSKLGVRNIDGFNERIRDARAKGEVLMHKLQTGFDSETGKPVFEEQPIPQVELPYIVILVDEFADLMLVAGKDVEGSIQRLAQMARAAGIHLIMATQRPSVDVITGVIKANFPTRISFQVTSKIDSRTILGEGGAEQLLGQGDMLYMASGGRVTRVHGPFVTDDEVEKIVKYLRSQGAPNYVDGVTVDDEEEGGEGEPVTTGGVADELYDQAVAIILRERKVSTSFVQRHLQIGYNRAANIIDRMEKEGLISAANHVGKREILSGNYGT